MCYFTFSKNSQLIEDNIKDFKELVKNSRYKKGLLIRLSLAKSPLPGSYLHNRHRDPFLLPLSALPLMPQ